MIAVGDGDTGVGGDINIKAGKTLADDGTTGGMLVLHAGESTLTSSGKVSIATPNAGTTGVSGTIDIVSGTSSAGGSGSISLTTGKSTGGKGGTITLSVGDGDTGVGGDININAGKTSARMMVQREQYTSLYCMQVKAQGHLVERFQLPTPNAGTTGVSGTVSLILYLVVQQVEHLEVLV